jgi:uncharacterized protein YceH (UPF0502 family)
MSDKRNSRARANARPYWPERPALWGSDDPATNPFAFAKPAAKSESLEDRIAALEARIAKLEAALETA